MYMRKEMERMNGDEDERGKRRERNERVRKMRRRELNGGKETKE